MADYDIQDTLSAPLYYQIQIRLAEGHGTQCLEGPMSTNMRNEAVHNRYVPHHDRWGPDQWPWEDGEWIIRWPWGYNGQESDRWL